MVEQIYKSFKRLQEINKAINENQDKTNNYSLRIISLAFNEQKDLKPTKGRFIVVLAIISPILLNSAYGIK